MAAIFSPGPHGAPQLLLIRRAEHPHDPWSGHIALPGGRVEPDDDGPLAAAVRETREEIGLQLPPDRCVGALDDIAAVGGRPGLVVRPYVFELQAAPPPGAFAPNDEVASLHPIGLDRLLRDDGRGVMELTWKGQSRRLPCVDFDGQRLWGLTLRMIDDLLDRLDGRGTGLARIR